MHKVGIVHSVTLLVILYIGHSYSLDCHLRKKLPAVLFQELNLVGNFILCSKSEYLNCYMHYYVCLSDHHIISTVVIF